MAKKVGGNRSATEIGHFCDAPHAKYLPQATPHHPHGGLLRGEADQSEESDEGERILLGGTMRARESCRCAGRGRSPSAGAIRGKPTATGRRTLHSRDRGERWSGGWGSRQDRPFLRRADCCHRRFHPGLWKVTPWVTPSAATQIWFARRAFLSCSGPSRIQFRHNARRKGLCPAD